MRDGRACRRGALAADHLGTAAFDVVHDDRYVAAGADPALLEGFLRNAEGSGKPLRETAGLADAAQKVGGMGTGLFGYENTAETVRSMIDAFKGDPKGMMAVFASSPFGGAVASQEAELRKWFDFSLLPGFDQVAKYFYFTVYAGSINADGLTLRIHSPTPPQLR